MGIHETWVNFNGEFYMMSILLSIAWGQGGVCCVWICEKVASQNEGGRGLGLGGGR